MKTLLVARLDLPFQLKIDNNFHVSLLKLAYIGFPSKHQEAPPPTEIAASDHEVYEVEAMLDSRIRRKKGSVLGTMDRNL